MEVKLEARSGLELGNALFPPFQDVSGPGRLQRGQAGGEALFWSLWWSFCELSMAASSLALSAPRLLESHILPPAVS